MRMLAVVLVLVVSSIPPLAPRIAQAQTTDTCDGCVLGLWKPFFSANFEDVPPLQPTRIDVGYWSSAGAPVQEVEFSVTNMLPPAVLVTFTPAPGATLVVGSPSAPADTTGLDEGGMRVVWDGCLPSGDVSVVELTVTPLDPLLTNHVMWVRRRFPSTVPGLLAPTLTKCGAAAPAPVTGGCFVINPDDPDGDSIVDGCFFYAGLPVEQTPWSQVKSLYK